MEFDETRHTGVWPFNLLAARKPFLANENQKENAEFVSVFDPVALSFEVSPKITAVGWVGLNVMPSSFLFKVLDEKDEKVDALIEVWVLDNKDKIVNDFNLRFAKYGFDNLAKQALSESLHSYSIGNYLSVVRTLMPEFERFGRMIINKNGKPPSTHQEAVQLIQEYIGSLPSGFHPAIESIGAFSLISDKLFSRCFSESDASSLNDPNRHAELHGLRSYGNLKGATVILSAADFLVAAVNVGMNQVA